MVISADAPPKTKSLRILVVEDQRCTSDFLVEVLAAAGHWVESCGDVITALSRMDQGGFDLLLTDVHLPDGNGWELITELTRRGKRPLRVFSMSAFHPAEARRQSMALRCSGHLVNPFVVSELVALLE